MLAAHTLKRVANKLALKDFLEVTVEDSENMDLADFDRRVHAGVLLDGIGDAMFREALQGRPKIVKGARSATNVFSYSYSFCGRAVIATFDFFGPEPGRTPHRSLAVQSSECPTATPRRTGLH